MPHLKLELKSSSEVAAPRLDIKTPPTSVMKLFVIVVISFGDVLKWSICETEPLQKHLRGMHSCSLLDIANICLHTNHQHQPVVSSCSRSRPISGSKRKVWLQRYWVRLSALPAPGFYRSVNTTAFPQVIKTGNLHIQSVSVSPPFWLHLNSQLV